GELVRTADRGPFRHECGPPRAAQRQTQMPAPAPESCTSSSWPRSTFFSCLSLDLIGGEVAAQFFSGRCIGLVGALVKKHKAHPLHGLWFVQKIGNRPQCYLGRWPDGIPECAGGN